MRMKWVAGRTSPSHCAHTGMPRNGNMKPDSRIDGSSMNTEACIACSWFWVTVEMVKPIGEVDGDEQRRAEAEQGDAALDADAEQQPGDQQDHHTWTAPMAI